MVIQWQKMSFYFQGPSVSFKIFGVCSPDFVFITALKLGRADPRHPGQSASTLSGAGAPAPPSPIPNLDVEVQAPAGLIPAQAATGLPEGFLPKDEYY